MSAEPKWTKDAPTDTPGSCPWCRVADVAVESMQCADRVVTGVDEDNGPVYWAECQRCGAQGPIVGWAADAIAKWNDRAVVLEVGVVEKIREALGLAVKMCRGPRGDVEEIHTFGSALALLPAKPTAKEME